MLPLGLILDKHGVSFHSYADDTQLYLSFNPNSFSALGRLLACVDEVKSWMYANFLSRLDYCRSLYYGTQTKLLNSRLQMVQNSAARLLRGTRKYDHITPVLRSWH